MGHMETAFKNITTLRVGGPIADFRSASSPAELAQIVTQAGTDMIIANGTNVGQLYALLDGKSIGTRFLGRSADV